jgi:hypothetical protein
MNMLENILLVEELRLKASQMRRNARVFPPDVSAKLKEVADELERRADAIAKKQVANTP